MSAYVQVESVLPDSESSAEESSSLGDSPVTESMWASVPGDDDEFDLDNPSSHYQDGSEDSESSGFRPPPSSPVASDDDLPPYDLYDDRFYTGRHDAEVESESETDDDFDGSNRPKKRPTVAAPPNKRPKKDDDQAKGRQNKPKPGSGGGSNRNLP